LGIKLGLSNKQKAWILKNRKKYSPAKMASDLNLNADEISEFLKTQVEKKTPPIFYLVLILIPILFFVLLEVTLRIADYGYPTDVWQKASETQMGLNNELGRRYFHATKSVPSSIEDVFDIEKKENSFRVFVLGGSSAAGYPYMPMGSFSRYIRKRLEIVYPESKIEVVNLSLTAVNSYTILDLMPSVLEEKPDLILLYAGHNEYYGALGVGSLESLGNSRAFINTLLYLNKFKTIQLLRNIIQSGYQLISDSDPSQKSGTLMSKMAKEQYIPLNSDVYTAGINQFKDNMNDVLELCRDAGVPVIMGNLVSNLKDQKPFISIEANELPSAQDIYTAAINEYSTGNYSVADSLFNYAKDLDGLRFRAPTDINNIITSLGKEFNVPVVPIEKIFSEASPNGIVGNNLMTDHLHPTLDGFFLTGKSYFELMQKYNYLPKSKPTEIQDYVQDSLTKAEFPISELDIITADFRIRLLKNDWPYIEKDNQIPFSRLYNLENFLDTVAYQIVMTDDLIWEEAHRKVAGRYLKNKDYANYKKYMDILIYQYPFLLNYYDIVIKEFIKIGDYSTSLDYLRKYYSISPNEFNTKWLGNIGLFQKEADVAIKYLNESISYKNDDPQVYFNLAGAYATIKDYQNSLNAVNNCLKLNQNFPGAKALKIQLTAALQ